MRLGSREMHVTRLYMSCFMCASHDKYAIHSDLRPSESSYVLSEEFQHSELSIERLRKVAQYVDTFM
jgi:hypothetical protein